MLDLRRRRVLALAAAAAALPALGQTQDPARGNAGAAQKAGAGTRVSTGAGAGAGAGVPSPHAIRLPPWFTETLLDVREDAAEAARDGKRLLIYFGQDGCPYCQRLMDTTFAETRIADKAKRGFLAIALNLWGDREVTWIDGQRLSEKALGRLLKVQFTPSILMFDEQARVVARLNGYYPPHLMEAALDHVAGRMESKLPLAEALQRAERREASAVLQPDPLLRKPPYDLPALLPARGGKPLLVLFERPRCLSCDDLHREGLARPAVRTLLQGFNIVRLDAESDTPVVTPSGQRNTARGWSRELGLPYAPALVFFDASRREVFRVDSYVRPFHLAAALDYVHSGSYRQQPSFQRFIQARADRARARGESVEMWR